MVAVRRAPQTLFEPQVPFRHVYRKGLRTLIDKAIKGEVNEVVIVHKDRLCRFGYDLIKDIITKYSNGKIT